LKFWMNGWTDEPLSRTNGWTDEPVASSKACNVHVQHIQRLDHCRGVQHVQLCPPLLSWLLQEVFNICNSIPLCLLDHCRGVQHMQLCPPLPPLILVTEYGYVFNIYNSVLLCFP
jgi:hypothetical protein